MLSPRPLLFVGSHGLATVALPHGGAIATGSGESVTVIARSALPDATIGVEVVDELLLGFESTVVALTVALLVSRVPFAPVGVTTRRNCVVAPDERFVPTFAVQVTL